MRVFIVDDHPVVRLGLRGVIEAEPDLEIAGEAANVPNAMRGIESERPDVVLVDLTLSQGTGIELVEHIATFHPTVRTLVISMHEETVFAGRALRAGAHGYLMKSKAPEKVVEGIRCVLKGDVFISSELSRAMLHRLVGSPPAVAVGGLESLTNREMGIYLLIGQGRSSREIAEELHLSIKTVETHRSHIKAKLGLPDSNSLVRSAIAWVQGQGSESSDAGQVIGMAPTGGRR